MVAKKGAAGQRGKRAPATSSRKTAAAKQAETKRLQKATTTLEKAELQSKVSQNLSSQRTLKRRSSEQAVSKIIKDNFPAFDNEQTDDKVNARGLTLREQLRADRKNANIKMGLKYYAAMRATFEDSSAPHKQLQVNGRTEPVEPAVELAIRGLESHPVDLSKLQALFVMEKHISQMTAHGEVAAECGPNCKLGFATCAGLWSPIHFPFACAST